MAMVKKRFLYANVSLYIKDFWNINKKKKAKSCSILHYGISDLPIDSDMKKGILEE